MAEFKFHIKVKKYITKVLIFHEQELVSEMQLVSTDDGKIFNGSLPEKLIKEDLQIYLLGKPATFPYCFNELFNIPLGNTNVDNFVVVNTPHDIQQVILTIPDILAEILQIPKIIVLADAEKSPFRYKLASMSDEEKKKNGINPELKQFVRYVPMRMENIKPEFTFLNQIKIAVTCYKIVLGSKLSIK
jgi:hypothetical protein